MSSAGDLLFAYLGDVGRYSCFSWGIKGIMKGMRRCARAKGMAAVPDMIVEAYVSFWHVGAIEIFDEARNVIFP